MAFLAELWRFIRVRKKFWLLNPVHDGGSAVWCCWGSAVTPFIYTLF
jgi:hypothetical protein